MLRGLILRPNSNTLDLLLKYIALNLKISPYAHVIYPIPITGVNMASECSRKLQNVSERFRTFRNVPERLNPFQNGKPIWKKDLWIMPEAPAFDFRLIA
jgi:hypothetical protein